MNSIMECVDEKSSAVQLLFDNDICKFWKFSLDILQVATRDCKHMILVNCYGVPQAYSKHRLRKETICTNIKALQHGHQQTKLWI